MPAKPGYWQRPEVKVKNRARCRARPRASERIRKGLPIPTRPCPEFCENCGKPPDTYKALSLDHCHATKAFRGWLCNRCNIGLGALGDTREALMQALAYLERAESETWLAIPGHGLPLSRHTFKAA